MSIQNRELERIYDDFASNYRACCMNSDEIKNVLSKSLTEKQHREILRTARAGWVDRLKALDVELAMQGEP